MSLLHDHSGKLFGKKKPTIRDIIINQQVGLTFWNIYLYCVFHVFNPLIVAGKISNLNLVDAVGGACCNWRIWGESTIIGVHHPESHPDVLYQGPTISQWHCWRTSCSTRLVAKVCHCTVAFGIHSKCHILFQPQKQFLVSLWFAQKGIFILPKVSRLRRLMKRSPTSKYKKLTDIKAGARLRGWNFVPGSKSEGRGVAWFAFRITVQFPHSCSLIWIYNMFSEHHGSVQTKLGFS